ncbi:MAG: cation:proton antiporter domain-containing protein, partial [Planctomycetota bacterium]
MDPVWTVVVDMLILLVAALVFGTIAEQLRQSAILGYLVAGTLVGPTSPVPFLRLVEGGETVRIIAELGVALLLFTIGLEFSVQRLRRMGPTALVGGTLQVLVTMAGAAAVAALLGPGLGWRGAMAIGAMVALSSTACVFRLLVDRAAVDSLHGRNAVGVLLIQDAAVIPLLLVVLLLSGRGSPTEVGITIGRTIALGAGLVGALYLIINHVVPRLLNLDRWSRNRELPILLAVILALGSAVAAHQVDVSPAMGAFVAGVLLGGSPMAVQVRSDLISLRTLMVTLFFASIGMLGEPAWVVAHWPAVVGVVLAIVLGKAVIVWSIYRLIGAPHGVALATGLCLAQVGEFSFVLAETAERGGLFGAGTEPSDAFRLMVSATIVTLFLTPFLVTFAPRVADRLQLRARRGEG